MINEMQATSLLSKLKDDDSISGNPKDIFNSATIGGARALNRTDIGRLQKGALADIVIINISNIRTGLVDDPIRSLVYYSNSKDIKTVIINGKTVLDNYKIISVDENDLYSSAQYLWKKLISNKLLNVKNSSSKNTFKIMRQQYKKNI